ncbi:MAG: restriction endonuclease [Melioribacteraceae bacterium]
MWVRDIKLLSPSQFELIVKDYFDRTGISVKKFSVKHNEKLIGMDGEFNIDVTIKYEALGVDFLVLVECKNHSNPIKRELVQCFKEKINSIGANKGIMFSSAKYQSGAIEYAIKHRIALIQISDGGLKYINRSLDKREIVNNEFMCWLVYVKDDKVHYNSEGKFIYKFIHDFLLNST